MTFERQQLEQAKYDREADLIHREEQKSVERLINKKLRESVWEEDFEIGGAL